MILTDNDCISWVFLNQINNMFKKYLFDNTDFNVFELKNKAEYDRLNKIRVDFIIFMCSVDCRDVQPTTFSCKACTCSSLSPTHHFSGLNVSYSVRLITGLWLNYTWNKIK